MADDNTKRVAVIGGGLVGSAVACLLAKRQFQVDVYESRADIRKTEVVHGRSINLAISKRGCDALDAIGIREYVVNSGVPMRARMIHNLDSTRRPIPYGKKNQYITSIDRRKLNEHLLTAAEAEPNARLHFEHKFAYCNFEKGELTLKMPNGELVHETADLIVGCDGAFSAVRSQMAKSTRLNFSQEYITHGYMELNIPATPNGEFAMETEYLHIWPRNEFMLIGLPNNEDKSFVATLFMPFTIFDQLKDERSIITFFENTFPDTINLVGKDQLVRTVMDSTPLPLATVKCSPYHVADRGIILGDAAHAMVPFYGQGLNCGLEDVLIFESLLDQYNNDFSKALPEYTEVRNEDCKAICDLAMYNYIEMRKSVNSQLFLLRKVIDNLLHILFPNTWVPLYTMVSFTRKRYSECIKEKHWQDNVLRRISSALVVMGVSCGTVYLYRTNNFQLSQLITSVNTIAATIPTCLHFW